MAVEEAIRQLKEYILGMNYMDDEAVNLAIEALEQTRWIPVSEKLPRRGGWYLVSLGDAWSDNSLGKVVNKKHIYDSNVRTSSFFNGRFYHGMVAAWMPLPDPYRGEEENDV